jgi:hypothetical protein
MTGAGVGFTLGPAAVQVRFALPVNRVAIITAYQRFVRARSTQCMTATNIRGSSNRSAAQLASLKHLRS